MTDDPSEPTSTAARDPLTNRQRQVLDCITGSISERGYPPTLREIGEIMGIRSTNGVNDHLKALERKGYLVREDLKSRALKPVNMNNGPDAVIGRGAGTAAGVATPAALSDDMVDIPLVGRVAAGLPLLAHENVEDTVRVDRLLIGKHREVFALRVQGESMIEDGIHDGDFIFVKKTMQAEAGQIVVVLIEDEATVKRYYPEGDVIRLQPANAAMAPIYVHKRDFRSINIVGVVVGVYRKV